MINTCKNKCENLLRNITLRVMGPWPLLPKAPCIHPLSMFIPSFSFLAFIIPKKNITNIFHWWQIHKCEKVIRDITPRVLGPWPLFYYHTSFSSGTKCGISFMDVGPETFEVLNKMWNSNQGHSSVSYGPLAPILLPHLLFFREQVWYKFHVCRSRNI